MNVQHFLRGETRSGWTLRLLAYIAVIVTLCAVFQALNVFLFPLP